MQLQARIYVQVALLAFVFSLSANASATQKFFTDFTDFTVNGSSILGGQSLGEFVVGNSQDATLFSLAGVPATFGGGVNGTGTQGIFNQGIRALYQGPPHAWLASPGGTLTLDFSTPVSEVSFNALSQSGTNFFFEQFGEISQIQFTNPSDEQLASIDDLSFTAVPVPAAVWLLASGFNRDFFYWTT